MKLPSSCEWTASYRSARARRIAVSGEREVERNLRQRRTDADAPEKGGRRQRNTRRPGSETSRPNGYVTRSTVWPELEQRADTVVFAERGAPGLEERLRRDHEDFHGVNQGIVGSSGERST